MPTVNTPTMSANLQMAAATRILTEHILYTLKEEAATHSSDLAGKSQERRREREETGGLQFLGSQRDGHE